MDQIEIVMVATAPSTPNEQLARENPLIKIPTLLPEGGRPIPILSSSATTSTRSTAESACIPASGPRRWEVLTGAHRGARHLRSGRALPVQRASSEGVAGPTGSPARCAKSTAASTWLESISRGWATPGRPMSISARSPSGAGLGYLDSRFAEPGLARGAPRLAGMVRRVLAASFDAADGADAA